MIIKDIHLTLLSHVDSDISDRFLLNVNGVTDAVNKFSTVAQIEWATFYWTSKLEAAGIPLCASHVHVLYTARTTQSWITQFYTIIVPILNNVNIAL